MPAPASRKWDYAGLGQISREMLGRVIFARRCSQEGRYFQPVRPEVLAIDRALVLRASLRGVPLLVQPLVRDLRASHKQGQKPEIPEASAGAG